MDGEQGDQLVSGSASGRYFLHFFGGLSLQKCTLEAARDML
ncbi:hypothetical protein CGMCC3_g15066 [Colletotrichum fructicola]|nr:uncharacterized protein CGMCC3_g15066 [Colletotrichum fructicola]KAE9568816.1 hypothetical protein CGMCC3_g15066 [Colletotrichum fructicola]